MNPNSRRRVTGLAAGIFCSLVVGVLYAATSANPLFLDAVWVGESGGVIKLDPASGQPILRIDTLEDVRTLAIDERAGTVWIFSQGNLYLYDFQGQLKKSFSAPMPPTGVLDSPLIRRLSGSSSAVFRAAVCTANIATLDTLPPDLLWTGALLATSPEDGSAWLALGSHLYQFSPEGNLLSDLDVGELITGIGVDVSRSRVWISTCKSIRAYEADGSVAVQKNPNLSANQIRGIDYDATRDELWLITGNEVRRFNSGGTQVFSRNLSDDMEAIVSDGVGNAWLGLGFAVQAKRVRRISETAATLKEVQPFSGVVGDNMIITLAAHRGDQSVWAATGSHLAHISVNGTVTRVVPLQSMGGQLVAQILSLANYADVILPTLAITAPAEGSFLNSNLPTFEFSHSDVGQGVRDDSLALLLNNAPLPANCSYGDNSVSCTPLARIGDGAHVLSATIEDFAGNVSEPADRSFNIDLVAPGITITAPEEGFYTNQSSLTITGSVSEPAQLKINGTTVGVGENLAFSHGPLALSEGENHFLIKATDRAGNQSQTSRTVALDTVAPEAPNGGLITVSNAGNGQKTVTGQPGSVEGGSEVTVRNARTGQVVVVTANADGSFTAQIAAQEGDEVYVVARDRAGNRSQETRLAGLPPDPATVAPRLSETEITPFGGSIAFLYSGANPIQTGVSPGTIEPKRAAVIRGRVLARDNTPLGGVTITVKDHPEYGQTLSRADGMFDMAVNGGGLLTVNYAREGFLPSQRQINTPWRDFAVLDDVVLIQLDDRMTPVDLGAGGMQTASGNPVTDADGARQATVMFEQGTAAEMVLPDGSRQPLASLNVRATEYTVGSNGPEAMPGALPATSGYTYAVELSVDQAMQAGATSVEFSKPVWFYVDNFLGFPVGTAVPAGYYDRDKSVWVPSDDGRVIKLLSVQNGLAELDVDGTGAPADATKRAALGITDPERQQIASRFSAGQSFWRVGVRHFTPWDLNWGFGPPPGATAPAQPPATSDVQLSEPDIQCASVIECQNQVLRERLSVAGTPYSLNYRSDRVLGRKIAYSLDIPVSGNQIPPGLVRIDLEIDLAGREFRYSVPAAANRRHLFTWDGRDAYGRELQGKQLAHVRIGYVYQGIYYTPSSPAGNNFAQYSYTGAITGVMSRQELTWWQGAIYHLGTESAASGDLGQWSLSIHHTYDADAHTLIRGDGLVRRAAVLSPVITTVAGNGSAGSGGDGGPATQATLRPTTVIVAPDGSLYIAEYSGNRVRRVDSSGHISTVAGNGIKGSAGDGGPATQAQLANPFGLAIGPDGSLYIAEFDGHRVRRVSPNGIITTVAGTGQYGFGGDGGPATQAQLRSPANLAAGPDGSIYIVDHFNYRIRRIDPDGIITTIAGNGLPGFSGDGGPATKARLAYYVMGVALDSEGNVYIADNHNQRVRRVDTAGIITTIAGSNSAGSSGDGGIATQATLYYPESVAAARDGTVYVVTWGDSRIRRIGVDRIITTAVGGGGVGFNGDNRPATQAFLNHPDNVAVGPDGSLYIADSRNYRIRKVSPPMPGFAADEIVIASDSAVELYVFDRSGRHLRTVHALTHTTLSQFGYDNAGRLITVADADGDTVTIERDGAGNPTAIVAPDGQRTTLVVDSRKHLISVTSPENETWQMGYTDDGLLTRFTTPRGHASQFEYDALGRLVRDTNAAGGYFALARSEQQRGYTVTKTSAESRVATYQVENLTTGNERRTLTAADGARSVTLRETNGKTTETAADGTVMVRVEGPDPRFGMQAPVVTSMTVTTPAGKVANITGSRSAVLGTAGNPLSLTTLTETVTLNGKQTQDVYTASSRTHLTTSPAGRQLTTVLDEKSRPVSQQITGIAATGYAYDPRGRLMTITQGSGADARTTTLAYGTDGYLASITDALNQTTSFENDAVGRVTKQTLPDGRFIRYGYDANGNLTSLVPPGRSAHVFEYNAVDLEEAYTPPELPSGATVTRYAYNLDKQPTRITRPDGQTIDFGYDAGGRLATISFPAPWTAGQGAISYSYHPTTGRLSGMGAPGGVGLGYSHDGFLLTGESTTGPVAGTVSWSYNNDFRVIGQGLNGSNLAFAYDNDGLLITAGALSLGRSAQNGLVTGSTLGNVSTSLSYNSFGELNGQTAQYQGNTLYQETITERDKLGRIREKQESFGGAISTYRYGYDGAGRLLTVSVNGVNRAIYTYDANGNRTHGNQTEATYDEQDRLLTHGNNSYTYTANGELLTRTTAGATSGFQYDVLGNLRTVSLPGDIMLEYVIDGRNRRIGKKVNGTLVQGFLYGNQLEPIAELDGNSNVVSRFIYADKAHVPSYMVKNGITYRIISDHLGSPRLVVNTADGSIAQRMDYDEFGNVTNDTNPGFQPFGFAGGLYDPHTQLTRFGARDYDAETGRWTAKDPIGFQGGDSNLYGYTLNDPVNLVDPTGYDPLAEYIQSIPTLPSDVQERKRRAEELTGQAMQNCAACIVENVLKDAAVEAGVWGAVGIAAYTATPQISVPLSLTYAAVTKSPYKLMYDAADFANDVRQCATTARGQ
jgi:RHS repeat-associated protein